jgi:hypothetical protein
MKNMNFNSLCRWKLICKLFESNLESSLSYNIISIDKTDKYFNVNMNNSLMCFTISFLRKQL